MKHTIKTDANGVTALMRNGQPLMCPFKTNAPIQDKFGQIGFMQQPCNSTCPLFNIHQPDEDDLKTYPAIAGRVMLHCTQDAAYMVEDDTRATDSPVIALR